MQISMFQLGQEELIIHASHSPSQPWIHSDLSDLGGPSIMFCNIIDLHFYRPLLFVLQGPEITIETRHSRKSTENNFAAWGDEKINLNPATPNP